MLSNIIIAFRFENVDFESDLEHMILVSFWIFESF